MRKRSKKRTPQDIKPWVRVKETSNEVFYLPGKKTTRWIAGGRRDWDTTILNAATIGEFRQILLKAFISSIGAENNDYSKNWLNKLLLKWKVSSKIRSLSKYKNYCLLSGRGRTYNRDILLARHNLRKLVGVGMISGLIK